MKKLFRFVVFAAVLASPAWFAGCGPSKITSNEIPTDIGDDTADAADDNPPEDE